MFFQSFQQQIKAIARRWGKGVGGLLMVERCIKVNVFLVVPDSETGNSPAVGKGGGGLLIVERCIKVNVFLVVPRNGPAVGAERRRLLIVYR
jgi:hypothetical protein